MNVNPGSPTQRIPSHNPDQQAPATTGVANNVDAADMAAIMAALQVAQTQAAPAASGYHEKMEFVIEHVPNSMESICGDEEIKAQLNQIAAIIKDMDPREVEIKVFSPCAKELGKLRGRAVKAYLKEQGVSEDLLDVKLRGPGRHRSDPDMPRLDWRATLRCARLLGVQLNDDATFLSQAEVLVVTARSPELHVQKVLADALLLQVCFHGTAT